MENTEPSPKVTVSAEEWLALKREDLVHSIERDARQRVLTWFGIMVVVGFFVGAIGVPNMTRFLIDDMVREELDPEISKAKAATAEAANAASTALASATNVQSFSEKTLDEVLSAAREAESAANEALITAQEQTLRVRELIGEVNKQIADLEASLAKIEGRSEQVSAKFDLFLVEVKSAFSELSKDIDAPNLEAQLEVASSKLDNVQGRGEVNIVVAISDAASSDQGNIYVDILRSFGYSVSKVFVDFPGDPPFEDKIELDICCVSSQENAIIRGAIETAANGAVVGEVRRETSEDNQVILNLNLAPTGNLIEQRSPTEQVLRPELSQNTSSSSTQDP